MRYWCVQSLSILRPNHHHSIGLYLPLLAPQVKSIVGVDINEASIARYNKRVVDLGLNAEAFKGVAADLIVDGTVLDGQKFDLVMVCDMFKTRSR